jgi:hypothetical protein
MVDCAIEEYDRIAFTIPDEEADEDRDFCESHSFRRWLNNYPDYKTLGCGMTRATLRNISTNCVIKFAYNGDGIRANELEVSSYLKIKKYYPRALVLFNPIRAYSRDYEWILVNRAHRIGEVDPADVQARLIFYGLEVPDLHTDNLGFNENGQPVIIDWGFGTNIDQLLASGRHRTREHLCPLLNRPCRFNE